MPSSTDRGWTYPVDADPVALLPSTFQTALHDLSGAIPYFLDAGSKTPNSNGDILVTNPANAVVAAAFAWTTQASYRQYLMWSPANSGAATLQFAVYDRGSLQLVPGNALQVFVIAFAPSS